MDIIVGTAGHIDHGKTALVKALTGVDADRLPEEKLRGITIDLGFAELELGDAKIGFVDVPGHEKFVKNMLAGASGIDFVILVIAADEGVMPQTREHFEICRLLGVKQGLIVLTKSDLADSEFLELFTLEALELVEGSFLEDAPVVAVSSKTGEGIEELKSILSEKAANVSARKTGVVTRLPIDRVFTVKGFGAVVTGTLATGTIETGQELDILPLDRKVRVRGIQTYGKDVAAATAGQRTAINLSGIEHGEIGRGLMLAESGTLKPTQIFDAEIEVLKDSKRPVKTRQRVRIHIGTVETFARIQVLNKSEEIKPGEADLVQFRLEAPICVIPDERFIVRQYSPQLTIAGGRVLIGDVPRRRKKDLEETRRILTALAESDSRESSIKLILNSTGACGIDLPRLQAKTGWRKDVLMSALKAVIAQRSAVDAENFYIARTPFDQLRAKIRTEINDHHEREPLSQGILRETLREKTSSHIPVEVFRTALVSLSDSGIIRIEKDHVCASEHSQELSDDEEKVRIHLRRIYSSSGLNVPALDSVLSEAVEETTISRAQARKIFQLLVNSQELIKVSEEFYFSRNVIEDLLRELKKFADQQTADRLISVAEFKDLAGISRKYAIPLLEYFDAEKKTRRAGDKRLIL
ncbi:MAG: selenocysteine-specific translation elongation factor [Pyrinomonadaceae bacterium]